MRNQPRPQIRKTSALAPATKSVRRGAMQSSVGGPRSDTVLSIVREVLRTPGQPLDVDARARMQARFGHDFSQVRVHVDARAADSASAVNALAYTVGRDVVFGANQYAPHSREGQKLIAHELAHVMQQRAATPSHFQIAPLHDRYEREATSVAHGSSAGRARVQDASAAPALQRQPAPPKDEEKKPSEKTASSQPPAQKVPALEVRKEVTVAAAEEKKGPELTATLGTETEIKRGEQGVTAEAADKFELELAIPITDKLQIGRLQFLKEATVTGSLGFPAARLYPKPLSSLELETSVKVLSLEFEKVKVPLGVADFGISGSALGSAGYNVAEARSDFKVGVAGEAEAKFKPGRTSPFFITAKVGVEKTFDKEGNADFKWSPVTWKTNVGVGFQFQ